MKTMTTSCDRTRLKDRILANVAKAIKCIQEFQILKAEECDLVLTNSDWQCHKLCEHLDHAFLHGLRHVTHGYWKVVTEFTRKGVVQEVQRLNHVTTDLGRGRSWLYIALNENLLESYMRCFMENTRYVKKYYVKEALVLDQQRLNVLVTLTSGLDYGTFKLEYNMPYLDLSSYQARPKSEQTASRQDEDKVSLCSMESSSSQVSSLMSSSVMSSSDYMHHRGYHDDSSSEKFVRRRTYSASTDSGYQVDTGNGITASRHLSMPNDTASTRALTPSEPRTRISRIESIVNVSESEEADSLEVIHVKSKGEHSKKKKKKVKKSIKKEKSSSDRDSVDSNSRQSKEDVSESTRTTPSEDDQSDIFLHQEPVSHVPITSSSPVNVVSQLSVPKDDSGYGLCEETLSNPEDTETDHEHLLNGKLLQNHIAKSVDKFVQNIQNVKNPDKLILEQAKDKTNRLLTNAEKPSIKTKSDVPVNVNPDSQISNTVGGESSHNHDSKLDEKTMEDQVDQNKSLYSDNTSEKIESQPVGESIYDDNAQILKIRSNTPEKRISHDTLPLTAPVNDPKTKETETKETNDLDLKVDNNTLLHLMLDVFEHEDEDFNKMYCTWSGHTEGETTIIFLLITNKSLYFLRRTSGKIFTKDASIPFKELDYISLSVGNQVIQIVCTNRRKQFWISVGDAEMTRSILSTVSEALDSSELNLPKLSVLTDATTQKIAMKKYAAKETNTDPQNVRILSYLLVHWEDPSSGANKIQSAHKDGHLLYRTKNSGHSWRTAFLSLRDGLLCLFHSKSDVKPHFFVKLSRETCGGCRRMLSNERNHCFEVVGLKNDSLQLAAENSQEASAWLQVLCQAVAESQQDVVDASRSQSCLPCCLILTPQKILMCHEDVQTSFFRTLGSASVVDVTAITEDTFLKTYLILEFESQDVGITSEQWVLYFNAANERTAFIEAFSAVWTKEFQVDVPIHQVQDVPLQTNCREMANYLRDSLLLK